MMQNEYTKKNEELQHLIEEQANHIHSLEEQHRRDQNEIEELRSENRRKQREIESLRNQLTEIVQQSTRSVSTSGSPQSLPISNPLAGLTIPQIKTAIQRENLTRINIPSSVTAIENYAFSDCTSLTHVTIPASVTSIGTSPFVRCPNLEKIIVESENAEYVSIDDALFTKTMRKLICCAPKARNTAYRVPSTVVSISDGAFFNCTNLEEIILPEYLRSIGIHTFYNCTSLTHITIPQFVESIGVGAFCNCTSLQTITIPQSVRRVECLAFGECSNLSSEIRTELETRFGNNIFR